MGKLFLALFTVVVLLVAGIKLHSVTTNTPDRTADTFTAALAAGEVDEAYEYLTPALTKDRAAYWKRYFGELKQDQKPVRLSHDYVADPFNTYAGDQMPERFVYSFTKGGKTHRLTFILVRHDRQWQVDEAYGSDVNEPLLIMLSCCLIRV